jgi:hypothetical protein
MAGATIYPSLSLEPLSISASPISPTVTITVVAISTVVPISIVAAVVTVAVIIIVMPVNTFNVVGICAVGWLSKCWSH